LKVRLFFPRPFAVAGKSKAIFAGLATLNPVGGAVNASLRSILTATLSPCGAATIDSIEFVVAVCAESGPAMARQVAATAAIA